MTLFANKYVNNFRFVSGTVTVQDNDCILACVTTSAVVTINLPSIPSDSWNTNWKLYVYDYSGNASTNSITLVAGTGQTINGASTLVISTNSGKVIVRISSNSSFNALTSFSSGVTQAYQTIQDEGSSVTQRSIMNFVGAGVTVNDDGSSKTTITINGGVSQAYTTVQDEGVALPQRNTIDFVGSGVTATDNGSKTVVTIAGASFVAAPYFYAKKSLTTTDVSFGVSPVVGGVNSIFGGQQVTEYTTKTENGLTFDSSLGEFTVPSSGLYSLNATFITRINATDISSLVNGSASPWCSDATSQIALGIMIETGSGGTVDDIVCSNKQTQCKKLIAPTMIKPNPTKKQLGQHFLPPYIGPPAPLKMAKLT
jgi:hypothetical protein